MSEQLEALTALNAHVEAMQAAMVTYLTGGSDKAFIGDMLVLLDETGAEGGAGTGAPGVGG